MLVVSTCVLPVAGLKWVSHLGRWSFTAVCRATISLLPGESVLAEHQEAPVEQDEHWALDAARSLSAATDLVPMKPRADITLLGHAYAPGGQPVRSLIAHLIVGEVEKSVEVVGERWFDQDGALSEGPGFSSMPLVYERASGGPGTSNPAGLGRIVDRYGRTPLPNLQPVGTVVSAPDEYIAPVGFGPIASMWPARLERLGPTSLQRAAVDLRRSPPSDLDPQYFNHAPRDQQAQLIRGRERVVLENLHPTHARFSTTLPHVRPRAVLERAGRQEALPLRCDTLAIDTDRMLCALTWRATLPLTSPDDPGRVVFSLEGERATGSFKIPDVVGATRPQLAEDETESDVLGITASGSRFGSPDPVLPFGGRLPAAAPTPTPWHPRPVPPPAPSAPAGGRHDTAEIAVPSAWQAPAVPLRPSEGPPKTPWAEMAPAAALTIGQRVALPSKPSKPVIPSQPPPAASPAASTEGVTPTSTAGSIAPPPGDPRPSEAPAAEAAKRTGAARATRAIQLVTFDREGVPRIRRKPAYQEILRAIEDRPFDPDLDDPAVARDPGSVEERRDVFEVIARAEALDEHGLDEAIERAVRDDGKFFPPLLLVSGELRVAFDEHAALRATVALAAPFATGDEELKAAIADARDLLAAGDGTAPAALADRFSTRILEAFRKPRGRVAPNHLDEQVARVLLERRQYQRREVLGATQVRALLVPDGATRAWPTYLKEEMARALPLFSRFAARLLVEAHLQEDQFEGHLFALRALAVARVVPLVGRAVRSPREGSEASGDPPR